MEYWIHKYNYRDEKKRKQFKKLLKDGLVTRVVKPHYNLKEHNVYHSETPIKIVRG